MNGAGQAAIASWPIENGRTGRAARYFDVKVASVIIRRDSVAHASHEIKDIDLISRTRP